MTIEITVDEADGELVAVLDNSLVLKAYREGNIITYSKSFSRIDDEETYKRMKKLADALLSPS